MVNTEQLTRIQTRVSDLITDYGNTVTLKSPGTVTYDEWRQPVHSGVSDTVTIGVTDNYFAKRLRLSNSGRLPDADLLLVLKGTETVTDEYTVEVDSVEYNIMAIEELKAANVVVAYQLSLGLK